MVVDLLVSVAHRPTSWPCRCSAPRRAAGASCWPPSSSSRCPHSSCAWSRSCARESQTTRSQPRAVEAGAWARALRPRPRRVEGPRGWSDGQAESRACACLLLAGACAICSCYLQGRACRVTSWQSCALAAARLQGALKNGLGQACVGVEETLVHEAALGDQHLRGEKTGQSARACVVLLARVASSTRACRNTQRHSPWGPLLSTDQGDLSEEICAPED